MTKHRPYIGAIFGPNAICFLLHLFTSLPQAGEESRGYLHGGIVIDFIGQRPPITKLQLLILDLLITGLQCFMLAVHVEQERLKALIEAPGVPGQSIPATTNVIPTIEDQDAEERGEIRDAGMTAEDIELRSMRPTTNAEDTQREEEELLLNGEPTEETSPLDVFYTGNAILADFHVVHTLRTQWLDYDNATSNALQTAGAAGAYSVARLNMTMRRFENMR
jgi:hypothetical protein